MTLCCFLSSLDHQPPGLRNPPVIDFGGKGSAGGAQAPISLHCLASVLRGGICLLRKHINTLILGVGVCATVEQGTETYLPSPDCTLTGWGPSWRRELNQGVISAIPACPPPPLWSLPACPPGCWKNISALRFAQPGSNPALSLTWGALGHPFPSLSLLPHLWCGDGGGCGGMRREAVACGG